MRLLRHPLPLVMLTGGLFLLMQTVEFGYFRRLSGGLPMLDYRLGFTADAAVDWINALGPNGAEAVLVWHYLTLDLVFPALFGLTLASLTLAASRRVPRLARQPKRFRTAAALLWVAPYVLADYLQNLMVAGMLSDPTGVDHTVAGVASALNTAKFVFAGIGLVALAFLWWLGRNRRGNQP